MPLGVFATLVLSVGDKRRAALVGLAVSATIELAQGLTNVFPSSGRLADVNDLLADTIGCVVGFVALRALRRRPSVRRPRPPADACHGPPPPQDASVRRRNSTCGPAVEPSHERLPG